MQHNYMIFQIFGSEQSMKLIYLFYFFFVSVTKDINLQPNCGSDRAWVWTAADFADEAVKTETLAIRFANAESKFCTKDGMIFTT